MIDLIWLQVNLLESGADELLHFSIVSINSCLENKFHSFADFLEISSRIWISTSHIWAELKELYRAFQRSSSSIHGHSSYWIALIAGSLCFLTQFISSHGLHFLFAISWILLSKKEYFVFFTVLLKLCQFSRFRESRYLSSDSQQLSFHHTLECLVIFISFKYFCHNSSILDERNWTTSSRASALWMEDIFKFLMTWMMFSINYFSLSLPFASDCCVYDILSLQIDMLTVIGAWSEESLQSEWMLWWLNSGKDGWRNTKSRTELVLLLLLENLVRTFSIGLEMSEENESAMSKSELLWHKWNRKLESQILSLMLKLSIMMMTLGMLTSVSFRYFEVNWDKLEWTLIMKKIEL